MSDDEFDGGNREKELLAKLGGIERVQRVLSRLLRPILGIREAEIADNKRGVDVWVDRPGDRVPALAIDIKCRERDFGQDLLIEFVSNTTTHAPGWTIKEDSRTDYVLYLWPERETLISYPQLRAATLERLPDWLEQHGEKANQTTTGRGHYRTRWIAVPDADVFRALGQRVPGGPLLSTATDAGGAHCPKCKLPPWSFTPEVFDPRFSQYTCENGHHWRDAA